MENLCELTNGWEKYARGHLITYGGYSCLIGYCLIKKGVEPKQLQKNTLGYKLAKKVLGLTTGQVQALERLNDEGYCEWKRKIIKLDDSIEANYFGRLKWQKEPNEKKIKLIRDFVCNRINEIL